MSAKFMMSLISVMTLLSTATTSFAGTPEEERELEQFLFSGEKYQIILNLEDQDLSKRVCNTVKASLKKSTGANSYKCFYGEDPGSANRFNKYQIQFSDKDNDVIQAKLILNQREEDDFDSIKWMLKNPESEKFDDVVADIAYKVADYDKHGKDMKEMLFYHGLLNTDSIRPNSFGMFDIIEDSKVVATVNKDLAKVRFMQEEKKNRNFLRAGIELATFLGIGKAAYIMGHDAMKEDWDFNNTTMDDFKTRLFTKDQMKFDDNNVGMNWGHAYAGVLYYSAARNNGFASYESLLITIASSSTWEYLGEYKEVVSINDQIVTGIGGAIIGETLFQISNMLKRKDSTVAKIIGASINPVGTLNDVLDGKGFFHAHESFTKKLGFENEGYSNMDIVAGLQFATNKKENSQKLLLDFGFNSEVINLPVENAGRVKSLLIDPTLAELIVNGSVSSEGLEDWQMVTKLALGGYFSKNIQKDESGQLKGYSFLIAPAVRTEYNSRGNDENEDFFAAVNVLGGTMDMTYYKNGTKIRFAVDVYGDFAFVRPYGLGKFKEGGGDIEGAKSVLAKRGYYYATGVTGIASLHIENGKNGFGIKYSQNQFESIDNKNLNRHEDKIINDYSLKDKSRNIQIYYTRSVTEKLKVMLAIERIYREGTMTSINTGEQANKRKDVEDRIWLSVQVPLQ